MPRATMDAVGDTARPRAGDEYEPPGPKPAQRSALADKASGAALPATARPRPVRLSPASLQRLGGAAGNRALANLLRPAPAPGLGPSGPASAANTRVPAGPVADPGLVVQRYAGIKGGGGSFAPPAPPLPPNPKGDPKFLKVTGELKKVTKEAKKHPPAKAEAKKAQDAAVPPGNDKEAQAKAKQADKLAGAKQGGFDKAGFIAALTSALTKIKPKNLEESDDLASSGKADQVKNEVVGKVADGKKSASQDLEAKAKEPPDPSAAKEKPVAPLKPEPEPKLATPKFDQGMPPKAPPEQTNLSGGKNEADAKLKEADVSEADLKKSNEPEMMKAVEAKKEGEEHSAKAPQEARKAEAQTIKSAENSVSSKGKAELSAMLAKKKGTVGQVQGAKSETKSKDEAERAKVTANVNKIFDRTKTETETILNELDGKVTSAFESGEAEAKAAFTNAHQTAMRRYKADRYGGFGGGLLWAKDKLLGMPEEVNAFYEAAKGVYIAKMTKLAHKLADLVEGELTRAKQRVQAGRDEIKTYVASLPKDLQKVGAEAAKAVEEKFDSLESDVDNKGSALQEELATKYTEAMEKVNADIEAMQAENKGLWDSIKDAIGGAIEAILKLKDLFMGMLAKAAGAFKKIISDPIGFIGNFLGAVKAGFMAFASRIGDHLKKGLQGWLFGKLGDAGIEIPDKLDLPGIIKMVLSILGLTWAAIRSKIVKRIGEKAMAVLETASDVFMILVKEGIPGLWKWIVDKVGDLKEMVVGQIRNFVIEKIVKAGITWVLGMLNPAGALIKIIQTLISVIQWIMEKGAALVELVGTIIDSVSDIAHGGMGGVPAKIEGALAKAVPIVISFLASLLGLGGIGEKIKSILDAVRGPVGKAVDAVIGGALKVGQKLIAKVGGMFKKKPTKKEKEKSKNVKAEAGKALQQALAGQVDPEQVQSKVDGVWATYHPKGLKTIRLSNPPTKPGQFDVFISASAETKATTFIFKDAQVGLTVGEQEEIAEGSRKKSSDKEKRRAEELEDRRLGPKRGIVHTSCVGDFNGRRLPRMESAGDDKHAERRFIDNFKALWKDGVFKADARSDGTDVLKMVISKSPCGSCEGHINGLRNFLRPKKVALDISVLALYEGPRTNDKGKPLTKRQLDKQKKEYVEVLKRLRAAGVRLTPTTAEEVVAKYYAGPDLDEREMAAIRRRLKKANAVVLAIIDAQEKTKKIKKGKG